MKSNLDNYEAISELFMDVDERDPLHGCWVELLEGLWWRLSNGERALLSENDPMHGAFVGVPILPMND